MTFLLNQYNKKSFRSSAEKQRDERIYFRGTTQLGKCPTQFPVTVKSVCLYTYGSKQRLPGPFIQTAIPDFHLRRLPWMASIRTTLPVLWLCICMSRVYHPRGMVSTGMEKVLRIDRPDGRRVHREKVDGPPGRRGAADAAGCVERLWKKVLKIDWPFRARGFLGLTAFQAEGGGGALLGDEYYNAAFRRSRPYRVS